MAWTTTMNAKGLTIARHKEEFGSRKTMRTHDLCQPSDQERSQHEITHFSFGSWWTTSSRAEDVRRTVGEQLEKNLVSPRYGRREGRKTLAFLIAVVFSSVEPRKWTGEWIWRRLMAGLQEIRLEFVDIIDREV